jgi:hypothetical protein
MADRDLPAYELSTRPCTLQAGRYRWDIRLRGRLVRSSVDSYPSTLEARAAGLRAVEKLRVRRPNR